MTKIKTLLDYTVDYEKSVVEPELFWEKIASKFKWQRKWDKILDLPALTKDFETYIYLYSFNHKDDNLNHSIKRVSIDIKNLMTSEITVPMTSKTPPYFVARLCINSKF